MKLIREYHFLPSIDKQVSSVISHCFVQSSLEGWCHVRTLVIFSGANWDVQFAKENILTLENQGLYVNVIDLQKTRTLTLKRKLFPMAAAILPYSDSGLRAPGVDTGRFGNSSKLKQQRYARAIHAKSRTHLFLPPSKGVNFHASSSSSYTARVRILSLTSNGMKFSTIRVLKKIGVSEGLLHRNTQKNLLQLQLFRQFRYSAF